MTRLGDAQSSIIRLKARDDGEKETEQVKCISQLVLEPSNTKAGLQEDLFTEEPSSHLHADNTTHQMAVESNHGW